MDFESQSLNSRDSLTKAKTCKETDNPYAFMTLEDNSNRNLISTNSKTKGGLEVCHSLGDVVPIKIKRKVSPKTLSSRNNSIETASIDIKSTLGIKSKISTAKIRVLDLQESLKSTSKIRAAKIPPEPIVMINIQQNEPLYVLDSPRLLPV